MISVTGEKCFGHYSKQNSAVHNVHIAPLSGVDCSPTGCNDLIDSSSAKKVSRFVC